MRNIFQRVKFFVVRGNFHTAAPTARAVKIQAARIRNRRAVDVELVVMKALVLRRGKSGPHVVIAFGQRIFFPADVELHTLRGRSDEPGAHASLGIDLRILLARLVY